MKKRKQITGKHIKQWYENHPVWVILGIILFVLSLAIATGTAFSFAGNFVTNQFLWRGVEQSKLDKLAPTQTHAYFKSVLGEPNTKERRGEFAVYTYRERAYWVEAFVDNDDVVQAMDVTACGDEGFYPKISNNPMGANIITLGKTKMSEAAPGQSPLKTHYYHKLATAPSYYYDEYYNNASGSYQTMFVGHNEMCGYLVLPEDIRTSLTDISGSMSLNDEQKNRFRKGTVINTFAVTSPAFNTGPNKEMGNYGTTDFGSGGIGVSYVDKGILTPARELTSEARAKASKSKDFDVIKYD